MNHSSPVTLRKVAPDANMHRQYTVTVTVNLFGTPLVICRWGRIGTAGQTREHVCATIEDAKEMAARLLEAKEQRGYGAGKAAAASRPARVRKPAAKLRRQAAGPCQLWLPGVNALPAVPEAPVAGQPGAKPQQRVLPKHPENLATLTARRQAPLPDEDRNRRLQMVMSMANRRGLSLGVGCSPTACPQPCF